MNSVVLSASSDAGQIGLVARNSAIQATAASGDDAVAVGMRNTEAFLASVNLTLSAEGIAHLQQELQAQQARKAAGITEDPATQAALLAQMLANRQAQIDSQPEIRIDHPLFSDPYTADRALSVSALVGMASKTQAAAVEDAVYAAIRSPVQQWTDSTLAVDLASQKMKLDTVVNTMIPAEKRAAASAVVSVYLSRQVEQADTMTLSLFQENLALHASLGDTAGVRRDQASIEQIKQGNYRSQQAMREALAVASTLDFSNTQSLGETATAAFGSLTQLVQRSMQGNPAANTAYWVNQVGTYREDWNAFRSSVGLDT